MENHIRQQAVGLVAAVGLGVVCAVLYDLLRAVRLRRSRHRPLTHLLDAVYAAAVLFLALWLALAVGGGRLRLYMLTGALSGALLWWLWPAALLRPAWDFWLDAAAALGRLLWRVVMWPAALGRKFRRFWKRVFPFPAKPGIMGPEHAGEGDER